MPKQLALSQPPVFGETSLTPDNIWIDLSNATEAFPSPKPCLFLDRDGVIVEDKHYMSDPADVVLLPGAADLIAQVNASGIAVVVVTNQSGIGRGYFGWQDHEAVQARISTLLSEQDAGWNAALACPHHRDAKPPYRHPSHPFRKPQPGLLFAAAEMLNLDLAKSWIVGDKSGDIEAGKNAKLTGGVYVATHPESAEQGQVHAEAHQSDSFNVVSCQSVAEVWGSIEF